MSKSTKPDGVGHVGMIGDTSMQVIVTTKPIKEDRQWITWSRRHGLHLHHKTRDEALSHARELSKTYDVPIHVMRTSCVVYRAKAFQEEAIK